MKTAATRAKFTLRLPPDLQRQLETCAAENNRSLNAEITHRLHASLTAYKR